MELVATHTPYDGRRTHILGGGQREGEEGGRRGGNEKESREDREKGGRKRERARDREKINNRIWVCIVSNPLLLYHVTDPLSHTRHALRTHLHKHTDSIYMYRLPRMEAFKQGLHIWIGRDDRRKPLLHCQLCTGLLLSPGILSHKQPPSSVWCMCPAHHLDGLPVGPVLGCRVWPKFR